MDKWLIPTALILIIICIFQPWFIVFLASLILIWQLIMFYYKIKTPPPYICADSSLNIHINWITKQNDVFTVEIYPSDKKADQMVQFHAQKPLQNKYTGDFFVYSIKITDLIPNQKYFYHIKNSKKSLFSGKHYWFIGPDREVGDTKKKIISFGDLQPTAIAPPLLQLLILQKVKKESPDFVLYLGDHTNEGVDPYTWRIFYHLVGRVAKNVPFLGVPGNHDLGLKRNNKIVNVREAYLSYVNYPGEKLFYGIQLFGSHIIAFNFNEKYDNNSIQYSFLKQQLEMRNNDQWLISLWHSSPYNSLKLDRSIQEMRDFIVPEIENANGVLWLGGHEHSYQRYSVNGVEYLTSAATSSFHDHLFNVENQIKLVKKFHYLRLSFDQSSIHIEAIPIFGKKIDNFSLKKA